MIAELLLIVTIPVRITQAAPPYTCSYYTDNTAGAGWQQLYDALNSNPNTAQALRWSTDIQYQP